LVCLSAANRDPQYFKNPHDLNISRDPNPHAAFAHGIHVCLGAPLARIEVQEAILGLIRRLEIPTLHNKELKYHPSLVHRALTEFPMSVNSIQEYISV
jgi:pimeloyl-[acyl-carrier protein] synthase